MFILCRIIIFLVAWFDDLFHYTTAHSVDWSIDWWIDWRIWVELILLEFSIYFKYTFVYFQSMQTVECPHNDGLRAQESCNPPRQSLWSLVPNLRLLVHQSVRLLGLECYAEGTASTHYRSHGIRHFYQRTQAGREVQPWFTWTSRNGRQISTEHRLWPFPAALPAAQPS